LVHLLLIFFCDGGTFPEFNCNLKKNSIILYGSSEKEQNLKNRYVFTKTAFHYLEHGKRVFICDENPSTIVSYDKWGKEEFIGNRGLTEFLATTGKKIFSLVDNSNRLHDYRTSIVAVIPKGQHLNEFYELRQHHPSCGFFFIQESYSTQNINFFLHLNHIKFGEIKKSKIVHYYLVKRKRIKHWESKRIQLEEIKETCSS
jgi:hypothetical protein